MKYKTKKQRLEVYKTLKEMFRYTIDNCIDGRPCSYIPTATFPNLELNSSTAKYYDPTIDVYFLNCLCHGVVLVTGDSNSYDLNINFPELYAQGPEFSLAYWFNTSKEGHIKRIECLDNAIKLCI